MKSSFVTRTVTTGPMTLDEMDPLLRGDSVDLDTVDAADDAAPVKIDEDGNVVGLSGLSELMRQSDAAHAQATAIARTRASDNAPPPAARVMRPADPASGPRPGSDRQTTTRARQRRRAQKTKNRNPGSLLIAGGLLALALAIGVLVFVVIQLQDNTQPITENPATQPGPDGTADPASVGPTTPDLFPQTPGTRPGQPTDEPDDTRDPSWLTSAQGKEANPDYDYQPASAAAASIPPADVPTVLANADPLRHEGWYILTPPRGSVEATGTSAIELGTLEPVTGVGNMVALEGDLVNQGEAAVLSGEAHIALLDASGRVFAETYLPFAALEPGQTQRVRLEIPLRHWGRARDVRTRAVVLQDGRDLDELPDVRVEPAGAGRWASARVTVRNAGGRWLRDVAVLVWAQDATGGRVASFRSVQDDLYIEPGDWLDIVVRTPIPEDTPSPETLTWHARVIRR